MSNGATVTVDITDGAGITANVVEGTTVTANVTTGAKGDKGDQGDPGVVQSVVAGTGIGVDSSDPTAPTVSLSAGTQTSLGKADTAVQDLTDLGITSTATELNYTDGVTSAIQTQLDSKVTEVAGTVDNIVAFDSGGAIKDSGISGTTLSTQITDLYANKQPLDADLTALASAGNSSVLAATTASFLTADETKLDGIEANADVTDATNVDAAGATMNTDTTLAGNSYFLDEDDMASNSATKVPSQQSVKAYVDAETTARVDADEAITKADNAKLSQWFTALASAKTTPVDILVIGDSISSLGYLTFDGLPYLHKLGKKFNERMFGLPTSDQWVYAKTDGNTPQMTSNAGTASTSIGTGGWSTTMANGQKATHTAIMDGISVQYGKLPTGGSLIVRDGVGGTVLTTISTAGTTKAGNVWHSNALTLGSHTIEIEAVVAGGEVDPILEGVFVHYGTRDKGVRVWNAAHGGWTTPSFTGVPARAYDFIEVRQPDLVILATGTNDDPGNIDSRVRQLVTDVKALTTKDILMWIPYTSSYFTSAEAEILRQIAIDEDLAVVDAEAVIGDITVAGLSADAIHPASGGTQKIADHIYSVIGADPGGNSVGAYVKPSTQTWSFANGNIALGQFFGYPSLTLSGSGGSYINFLHPSVSAFFGYTGTTLTLGDGAGVVDVALSRTAVATLKVTGTLVVGTAGTATGSAVTIDGTQTLTNKTHTSPVINTGVSGTAIDTDGTLAGNSDTKLASQKAVKTYVDSQVVNLMADTGSGTISNTTTETSLQSGTITITAGTLSVGDSIFLTYGGAQLNNSGANNSTTLRLKLNGSAVFSPAYSQGSNAFDPQYLDKYELIVLSSTSILVTGARYLSNALNTSVLNKQVYSGTTTVSDLTSNNLTIDYTFQWGTNSSSSTVTTKSVIARLIKG